MRVLAQAIFSRPDVLLLDEPTNDIDIETISWLRKFLADYDGCIIVFSHDRHFLNRVCTHVCDVDFRTIRQFVGIGMSAAAKAWLGLNVVKNNRVLMPRLKSQDLRPALQK